MLAWLRGGTEFTVRERQDMLREILARVVVGDDSRRIGLPVLSALPGGIWTVFADGASRGNPGPCIDRCGRSSTPSGTEVTRGIAANRPSDEQRSRVSGGDSRAGSGTGLGRKKRAPEDGFRTRCQAARVPLQGAQPRLQPFFARLG